MLVLVWLVTGFVIGLIAHLILRACGEQGYNIIGEGLLGVVGATLVGIIIGILGAHNTPDLPSVLAAAVGAALVEAVVVYVTLSTSPERAPRRRSSV